MRPARNTYNSLVFGLCALLGAQALLAQRPRARDLGVRTGSLPPGPLNAITDVPGVLAGHSTLIRPPRIRTGVTAIVPHSGNLFRRRVPAAILTFNGFGKIMGTTQVEELGELESPILLTSTLNIARVADSLISHMLETPGNEDVRSINVVVAETNDGALNDIRSRPLGREHVDQALRAARTGPVAEGAVGAGAGTIAFGFKAGIGTSSRRTPSGHTVGILVQSNFGGDLHIAGVPIGRLLKQDPPPTPYGSIIIVVATDAPLTSRNLKRLAARTMLGLGRTGAAGSNGSGDYAIAFSTQTGESPELANDAMSPLFLAAIEATEEAIYNSLFAAETVTSNGRRVEAMPVERVMKLLRERQAAR